jgi:hypothetical protein
MDYNVRMLYALIGSNTLMILVFILKYSSLPSQIPLFYSLPQGDEQIVDLWMIAVLPIIMNGFIGLNVFISKKFFPENWFAKRIFYYMNYFILVLVTVIFIKIVFQVS